MSTRVSTLPVASPYLRLWLALGEPPTARVRGWVAAHITGGADNVLPAQLCARYGRALTLECSQAGFTPAYGTALDQQAPEARVAAGTWAERVLREGAY